MYQRSQIDHGELVIRISTLLQHCNNELSKVSQWLAANKLSINVTKTKYMVFHLHKKVVTYPDLQLNGNKIERVTHFNFLGLILQSNLS